MSRDVVDRKEEVFGWREWDRQDGVRVADWLRANFATGMGEDWGCGRGLPCTTFLAFLASWLLAQWLLASASTFSQAAEPLPCKLLKVAGALARPAVSAAARVFHGSRVIGHREPSRRSLPSPRRPSSMACGFCRCGVWTLKPLWATPWQGCAQANVCRRPLCWGVFPASQHSPGRLFNPFHKWAVPQNLQVPAKPQKE
jgi:hypothetical protein